MLYSDDTRFDNPADNRNKRVQKLKKKKGASSLQLNNADSASRLKEHLDDIEDCRFSSSQTSMLKHLL